MIFLGHNQLMDKQLMNGASQRQFNSIDAAGKQKTLTCPE